MAPLVAPVLRLFIGILEASPRALPVVSSWRRRWHRQAAHRWWATLERGERPDCADDLAFVERIEVELWCYRNLREATLKAIEAGTPEHREVAVRRLRSLGARGALIDAVCALPPTS
jgi:hypothetical protein